MKAIEAIQRIPTPEEVSQALRDRQEAIAPIVKLMMQWMEADRPCLLVTSDGTFEPMEPVRTPEAQKGIDQCKAWIDQIDAGIMWKLHNP